MPLTQQQKDWVITQSGYSPQTHQLDDDGYISEKPAVAAQPTVSNNGTPQPKLEVQPLGAGGTFVKEAIHSAPSTVMGGVGAVLGGAAGGALVSGPFAPVGAIVGGIAGGLGLGMGTSYLQNKLEENVVPEYVQELQASREAHPVAALGGRLAAMPLGGMNPNLPNVAKAAGTTAEIAKRAMLERSMRAALAQTKPSDLANVGNVGIGAGLGTGMAVGGQLAQGKSLGDSLTSLDTLEGLLGGAVFNKPNSIGNRMGFHDVADTEMQHALAAARELRANAPQAESAKVEGLTPEQQALADEAKKGLYEKKEGAAWGMSSRDILDANQAAEQRGVNPAKAAELEAQRVAAAGLLTPEQIYQQKVQKELQRLQSLRRKADFEKATLELQQQQQAAQAEIAAAQAAKVEAKNRQQLQMKLGVQATPEAIVGRALAAPENRPATPRGNNKRVAKMQEELVDPLQDEADAIQERLERKNQDPEEAIAPLTDTELAQQVRAKEANVPIDDFVRTVFDAQAKTRGADVSPTDEAGSYALVSDQLKRMAAKIGTKEGSDTRAHEAIGHIFMRMLKLSPYKSDQQLYKQALTLAENSPELKAIQAKQQEAGTKVWDAEEFIANQQGLEWLMADPAVRGETANKKWFNDFKVKMKSLMGNANAADVRRLINYKWHNDAPFEQYYGKNIQANVAGAGTRVEQANQDPRESMSPDEGFNSKEGDDILSSNEDIEVVDALPAKLPAPPEGYRRVKVVKPDGGSYEAFFNDKYYDMGAMGKFASIAKMTEGGLTHGVTAKGETIQELPSQLYRRNQNPDEAMQPYAKYPSVDSSKTLKSLDEGQSGNYWIAANGDAIPVLGHAGFAEEFQNKPARRMMGDLYDGLYDKGWHRVVIGKGDMIYVQAKDRPSNAVIKRLTDVAIAGGKSSVIWDNQNGKPQYLYNAENRVNQDPSEAMAPKGRTRTKEEQAAQDKVRRAKYQQELAAIRAAAGVEPERYRSGGPAIVGGVGLLGPMPNQVEGGVSPGRPNLGKSTKSNVSLDTPLPSGDKLIDIIADPKAEMPGESIADTALKNVDKVSAKETVEERIARKADEQLARLSEAAPDNEAPQVVQKQVQAGEAVHTSELDHSYADMHDIIKQGLKDLADKREDLVAEYGEDGDPVANIDEKIQKQQKMLEWVAKQDPTKRVDLKSIQKVYQDPVEAMSPRERQVNSPEFKRWFGGSKVIDKDGKPLVVYHGTDAEFTKFEKKFLTKNYKHDSIATERSKWGFWFTENANEATYYPPLKTTADRKSIDMTGRKVMPVYLKADKVKTVKLSEWYNEKITQESLAKYDALHIIGDMPHTKNHWVLINDNPANIKSATGNSGTFDPANPDIRYQNPAEAMTPKDKADFYAETGVVGKGLLHTIASEVDKLKQMSPVAGKAAETFLAKLRARRGELEGGFNYAVKKVRKAGNLREYWYQDNPDYQAVVKWRDAMMDKGVEPFALTPTQQKINQVISDSLKQSLDLRESFKDEGDIEGLARGTKGAPNYLPHVMSREASSVLAEKPTSAAAEKFYREFMKYRTEMKGQTVAEAEKNWKTIRDSFNQLEEGNIAARFGAIDKAMGNGLPASMREQNLMDRMGRFNRRFARRVAYHEAIQRNPEAHDLLFNSTKGLASTRVGKNVLQDMFGIREHQEATRSALSGVVRAAMLGPLTGAKDVVAGQVLGLQHMGLAQVLPAKAAALRDWSKSYERAVKTGIVREGYGGLESGEGGLKNVQQVLMRSRDVINQVQGRQLLETASRVLNYGEGRYLALDAFNAIRAGRLDGTKRGFLDDFVPDWQKYKKGEVPTEVLDEAAAKYVESVQGTYDYRGLPEVAMKGTLSPYLSLARWNVEKFNNFTKHVVQPATKGNYKPLLMATLGAFIGGTAVNALVAEVTGRKERTANWDEIANSKEQTGLIAYKLAALASLAGYSGMLGDLVKSGFDAHYKNRVQTFSNPLVDAGGTVLEDGKFLVQALQAGDMPAITDVLHLLASDYIQAYRVALPHISSEKQKELEDANNRRDLKVWKMGEGMPIADSTLTRPNPLINKDMRQFKQTSNMAEAAGLLPALIDKAIKKATDENGAINPEILKAELSRYKRNSYQTVPSFEQNPIAASQYINWLGKTQGADAASRRIEDYVRRNAINRAKSDMIPSL